MIQILIVDDEKPICDLIQMSLTRAGYHCTCVYDGLAAADILERNVFDLILLDVMLPNADGFELMEYIRPLGIPVIFLTARGSVDDRVRGLRMGAEDYIVKPFEVVELLARVDALYRRIGGSENTEDVLSSGPFVLHLRSRTLDKNSDHIRLTQTEFAIMKLFMENPGRALSREDILHAVWGADYNGEVKIVDVNIRRLRIKIEDDATEPEYITTVWGYGYKWGY